MLLLSFMVAGMRYGLDSRDVVEVLPDIRSARDGSASEVFVYHGVTTKVCDLTKLCSSQLAQAHLTTRVIVVRSNEWVNTEFIGLLAESVTETCVVKRFAELPATPASAAVCLPSVVGVDETSRQWYLVSLPALLERLARVPQTGVESDA